MNNHAMTSTTGVSGHNDQWKDDQGIQGTTQSLLHGRTTGTTSRTISGMTGKATMTRQIPQGTETHLHATDAVNRDT